MTTTEFASIGALRLTSGTVLPDVVIAYSRYGTLAPDGRNAIVVTHGYTANHGLLAQGSGVAEGAWAGLIGPGRPLDPQRYCILCPNMLGSCYGSTGPTSMDPDSGRPYGADFPDITFHDIVASQRQWLDALGVRHLRAVMGPSLGGFQALQWAVDHPDFVDCVGAIVSGPCLPASPAMSLPALQQALDIGRAADDGEMDAKAAMNEALRRIRLQTLASYGMPQVLAAQGVPADMLGRRLEQMAAAWAESFSPHSLVVLLKAAQAFDVRPQLASVRAEVLHVVASSDTLFPPDEAVHRQMQRIQGRLRHQVLQTELGHSSSGPLHAQWGPGLRDMLATAPSA
ncbi:alpha/beta fold hydrolase [Corticibacter populi]|uniref:Alpha/beta fold hydrolase n=1 Tax=Corticibacter populi TaxID=1550736 RepID=A0A3M6QZX3_9BURK|nr:alpha/beta fold hydrolase [Corticibacter populi]RMX08567.1 alpha/beta fold hydrolase [Corticibacter populi]RZS35889.1 homoserine O-acetyltransferase [Corticibacter populi]